MIRYLTGDVSATAAVRSSPTFCYLLAAALVEGMLVSWSPKYLAVTIAQAGVLLTGIVWASMGRRFHFSRLLIPVALISVWGLLQILLGTTISQWDTRQGTLTWFTCGVAFFLASTILSDDEGRERFLSALFWATTVLAVLALLDMYRKPVLVFGLFPAEPTVVGTFLYKNHFAAMLELAAPIALYRMLASEEQQWVGAGAYAVMFGAAVGASSRSGVLLLSAELIVALLITAKRRLLPWKSLIALAAGLLVLVSVSSVVAGTQSLFEHFQENNPFAIRQKLLVSTLQMVRHKPLLGYGIGTWPRVYPAFAKFDNSLVSNEARNDWAQWAAEGGIPFALLVLALALTLAKPAVRSIWAMGLAAVMVQSLIDYPTREPVLAIFWFMLAGALSRSAGQGSSG